jgi:hypothetical protein
MRQRVAPPQRDERAAAPQICIEPVGATFVVRVGGEAMRVCGDELDAHHWGKHAFEAVNKGLRRPAEIQREMQRLCATATRFNLHR